MYLSGRNRTRYCPLSDYLVENFGRLGYKTDGKGWFKYVGERRTLTVDAEVTKMIEDYREAEGITPRNVQSQVINVQWNMVNQGLLEYQDVT